MTEKRQILKSAWVITLATIASRICGYFRDQRITLLLGTSVAADSFVLAFRIPNLLRRLIGEGSLTASFIPVFTGYLTDRPRNEVWKFAHRLFWTLVVLLAALTVLGIVFSPQVIYLFTLFGKARMQWEQAVFLNRIIFTYVFFIGLAALFMAILNTFHVFGLPASTPIFFNLSVIAFSIGAVYRPVMKWAPEPYRNPATALALGILVGGILQFLVQVPELVRRGMRFRFDLSFHDPGVRRVGRLLLPGFFGIGVFQVNFFVDTIFATSAKMPGGSITSLYVADRVMELVLGSYAIAVSTAILPLMSRQAASQDFAAVKQTLTFALRMVSFITIPAALGLVVLREPIIQVLFQHGRFVAESTQLTARALLFYAMGLPGFASIKLIVPAFYAHHDTRTPVLAAAWATLLNIVLNILFLKLFFRTLLNGSPALATSLASYFDFAVLFAIFRKRFGRLGGRGVLASVTKVAIGSVAMGICSYAMLRFSGFAEYRSFLPQLVSLAGMIVASVAIYLSLAHLLRCEEVREVNSLVGRRETGTG